eukprot:gnl/MRDRNA2_/MRDRNA2_140888_c0_seq1.p1 gnl/MRDRNA2_/MRDRNA2_140888_c0~~gnl/MRDRNA2_/MRDRNA2_140888_c0_seq1.p1  ORF type:complete len:163 (+),score=39.30 gnl/MRDRNA2_/MRDRNA2_140888_c0_seq1:51-491(+)
MGALQCGPCGASDEQGKLVEIQADDPNSKPQESGVVAEAATSEAAPLVTHDQKPAAQAGRKIMVRLERQDPQDALGMDVRHSGQALELTRIVPGKMLDNWNKAQPSKAVSMGDMICSVNGIAGSDRLMINECKESMVLELEVQLKN